MLFPARKSVVTLTVLIESVFGPYRNIRGTVSVHKSETNSSNISGTTKKMNAVDFVLNVGSGNITAGAYLHSNQVNMQDRKMWVNGRWIFFFSILFFP